MYKFIKVEQSYILILAYPRGIGLLVEYNVYGFPTYGKIIKSSVRKRYTVSTKLSNGKNKYPIIECFILTDIDYLTNDKIKF